MSLSMSFPNNKIKRKIVSLPKDILVQNYRPAKGAPRCARLSGVLTLEAAVIAPCLLFFFISILFFFRAMQVQLEVQKAADETARRLAVYMAIPENAKKWEHSLAVKALFTEQLSQTKYADSYIKGGILGISLAESDWSGKEVDLKAEYRLKCPIQFFGVYELRIISESVCRKWTGFGGEGENETKSDTWVYIAETGTVYHKSEDCTYLRLSIQSVEESALGNLRNENGGKYKKCLICADTVNKWNRVYITNQGDRYHFDLNCSGLKRTVSRIRLSEVGERKPCSRCRPPLFEG